MALFDQLKELSQSDYRDDWARFCHLVARINERQPFSPEEAFLSPFGLPNTEAHALRKKFVEHFVDVFRNRLVGRIEGSPEAKPIPADLVRPEALRFAPDRLVLDKGKLTFVDVRVEPAPAPQPSPSGTPSAATVPELSDKDWKERILEAYKRSREELCRRRITSAAQTLKDEFGTAVNEPPKLRYIESVLRDCYSEDFPKTFRGSKQRPQ
jgi:hypothetical protein